MDGTGDAPGVQAAIESAATGDEIIVSPGTYYENLDYLGKDVVLRSELGPEVTILDGSMRDSSVVIFKRGETRAAVLEGFTITGGSGSRWEGNSVHAGGGINCVLGSPVVRNNRIVGNNTALSNAPGGGMLVGTNWPDIGLSAPLIEENLFEGNYAHMNGGGLGIMAWSEVVVRRNVFRNNGCRADGGGVWAWLYKGFVVIQENEFWDNVAGDHGGGMYASRPNPGNVSQYVIERNLFVRNKTLGPGFFGDTGSGGGLAALSMSGRIEHNTFVANDGQHLTDCGGGGLLLYHTDTDLSVAWNIFVMNRQCGIACWTHGTATMGPNLVWSNDPVDLGIDLGECPTELANQFIIADPLFCGPAVDDYRVASNSPAVTENGILGAFREAGCGPGVPVRPTTWGRIKNLYR